MAISLVENGKKKEGFIDFTPYFNKIKHKLVWCLAVVIVAAVASFILTRFMSSSYTATATVLFKAQSQDISPLPRLENYDSTRSDYYETKYALMGSRVVLDAAVRKLKLYQDSEFNGGDNLDEATRIHNAIQALERSLTISGVRTTSWFPYQWKPNHRKKPLISPTASPRPSLTTACNRSKTSCFRRRVGMKK